MRLATLTTKLVLGTIVLTLAALAAVSIADSYTRAWHLHASNLDSERRNDVSREQVESLEAAFERRRLDWLHLDDERAARLGERAVVMARNAELWARLARVDRRISMAEAALGTLRANVAYVREALAAESTITGRVAAQLETARDQERTAREVWVAQTEGMR